MSISKTEFINYYVDQVRYGNVSLFLGAGASASTGLPSWANLLEPCARQLKVQITSNMDLFLLAQYYANEYGNNALKRIINESVNCISNDSDLIDRLLDLNFKSIWTTNYDKVIEDNLARKRILTNSIHDEKDLPNTRTSNRVSIYKMNGDISNLDRIVITQKDIENYGEHHEMLLTFFKRELVVNSFLFLGYSFSDDIVLSCLSAVNRCLEDSANFHFAILKDTGESDFIHFVNDLEKRYHIRVLLINDYSELPGVLSELKEAINKKNVFFSGVFERLPGREDVFAEKLCKCLTASLLKRQYHIYTGYGRNFGNYLSGSSIQYLLAHNMEIDRYLIMRPFLKTMAPEEKRAHRNMLLSNCRYAIFMYGQSPCDDGYENSSGMMKEYEQAKALKKIIIPVGCTGYTSSVIWEEVRKEIVNYPYLERYMEDLNASLEKTTPEKIVEIILQIMNECE